MKKCFKTEGVVLRRSPLGEADQIVTLLSPDFGKIACLAKGCRKLTSKFCGRLELFYELQIIGYWGRNFVYLKEVEVLEDSGLFELDLVRHYALATVAEITYKLIPEGAMTEGAYLLLCRTIRKLKRGANPQECMQKYLEALLACLGFMPTLTGVSAFSRQTDVILKSLLNGPLKSEQFLKKTNDLSWSGQRDSNPRPSPWQGDALAN